jgi:salicylate hydroxylase
MSQDAYVLATVLGHPGTTRETLGRALSVYDHIRRPMALKVMEKSRLNGQYFSLHAGGLDFDRLAGRELDDKLQLLGDTFTKNWEWAWTTSADAMVHEALRMLES